MNQNQHITFEEARKSVVTMNLINGFLFDSVTEDRESDRPSLPKRQRYYSALHDTKKLATSTDYRLLPDYVSITILSYDPFQLGDMYYEARSDLISHKDSDYVYDDGIVNIFLYAGGRINTPDTAYGNHLKEMLKYIVSGDKPTSPDEDIDNLDSIVTKVKFNAEVTKEYMKQWDREATLQREAADATKKDDGIKFIKFGRELGASDDTIRARLESEFGFDIKTIDELFEQVDG